MRGANLITDPRLREWARMGGKAGGVARAEKLSAGELTAIGKQGAAARWKGHTRKHKPRRKL